MAKAKDFFSTAGSFVNGMMSGFMPQTPKGGAVAQEIVNSPSPLAASVKDPSETLKSDPLAFTHMRYPYELGNEELGHYIIFYSLTNNFGHIGRDFDIAKDMGWSASYTGGVNTGSKAVGPAGSETESYTSNTTKGIIDDLRHDNTPQAKLDNHSSKTQVPENQTVTSSIALYMPPAINVQYKNGYEVEAAELSGDILRTGQNMKQAETRMKALEAFLQGFTGASASYLKQIGGGVLDTLGGGDLFRLSTKQLGVAVNPRNEQYYNGPGFRSFSYNFDFYPKNAEEAKTVSDIVKLFKYHSSASMLEARTAGRFFVAPSEFEIHYMYRDNINDKLHKISRCVCTDVDVRYGPEEQFSTFDDGHPVTTNLALTFTELEFITKEKIFPSAGVLGA